MADVRIGLVSTARARIAVARGIAQAELQRAEQAFGAAQSRLLRARRIRADVTSRAAIERDTRLADALVRHETTIADLARHASDTALSAAHTATPRFTDSGLPNAAALPVRIGHMILGGVEVPALIPLLDRSHLVLNGSDRAAIDRVLLTLLTRTLEGVPPGSVRILGYDPEHLGGRLAPFSPLATAGLLSFSGPRGLTAMLDDLVDEAHRISHRVLAGDYASLRDRAERQDGRIEPWRLAVLLGDGSEITVHERAQLRRLLRTGVACGIHVIASGVPYAVPDDEGEREAAALDVTTIDIDSRRAVVGCYPTFHVVLDVPPHVATATDLSRRIAERATTGPPPIALDRLLPDPEKYWTERAAHGLMSSIGEDANGHPVGLCLSDHPPHALIGGPTGSGKTNLIFAWLAGLTTRYSPDELELYLLDFKEGVSFARFAPTRRDPTWLPHVRLVGLNMNTDREFGVALLLHLGAELRHRAEAAKRFGVTKLAELREEDPSGRWPRIVAIIDEFQVLFGARDALTTQAVGLLEDLARRGRSQGIHLVLASQDVSGIEALWGRSALLAQLTLRIALPKARRVLVETNTAADEIPRYHAVVNTDSGVLSANRIVRIPDAGSRATWHTLLSNLSDRYSEEGFEQRRPRLFDGDVVPLLDDAPEFLALRRGSGDGQAPKVLLGESIDVEARSAEVQLRRMPGRNIAVLGTASAEARAVLDAAVRSLARQYDDDARFSVAWLERDAHPGLETLRTLLPSHTRWFDRDTVIELLREATASFDNPNDQPDVPHFILLYAVDAAAQRLAQRDPGAKITAGAGGTGHELLRKLLNLGPERGTHVIGWWRSTARLRDDLGGITARFDAIGAWVALNVHGGELSPLTPSGAPAWYPRPGRALFFDRAKHHGAEVMIPYRETR